MAHLPGKKHHFFFLDKIIGYSKFSNSVSLLTLYRKYVRVGGIIWYEVYEIEFDLRISIMPKVSINMNRNYSTTSSVDFCLQ